MASTSEQHYRGEAGRRYQTEKRAVPPEAFPWVARLRAEKLQPFIKQNDVVVEFGAGLGWNLAQLRCRRRIATDLEDHLPPDVRASGVEFATSAAGLPDGFASVVLCHHVLEHVANPAEMLREAWRILSIHGTLLAYVPYEKERRYRHYNPLEPNHHLFAWNPQTFANLIASQGFTIESAGLGTFGYDRFAAKLAVRMRLGENAFRMLRCIGHLLRPGLEVRVVAVRKVLTGAVA